MKSGRRDLVTGETLGTPIESAYGSFCFSPDGVWVFWIWRDENARPSKIFRRPARGGEDVLIYEEKDRPNSDVLVRLGAPLMLDAWFAAAPSTDPTGGENIAHLAEIENMGGIYRPTAD